MAEYHSIVLRCWFACPRPPPPCAGVRSARDAPWPQHKPVVGLLGYTPIQLNPHVLYIEVEFKTNFYLNPLQHTA